MPDGSFYLADSNDHRVRKVSASSRTAHRRDSDAASALGDDIYNESGAGQTLVKTIHEGAGGGWRRCFWKTIPR